MSCVFLSLKEKFSDLKDSSLETHESSIKTTRWVFHLKEEGQFSYFTT